MIRKQEEKEFIEKEIITGSIEYNDSDYLRLLDSFDSYAFMLDFHSESEILSMILTELNEMKNIDDKILFLYKVLDSHKSFVKEIDEYYKEWDKNFPMERYYYYENKFYKNLDKNSDSYKSDKVQFESISMTRATLNMIKSNKSVILQINKRILEHIKLLKLSLGINNEKQEKSNEELHKNIKPEHKNNKTKNTRAKFRIEWKLKFTDLTEFLELLKIHNLITENSYKNMNVIIRDCFTDENGNDFDNQKIAKTKFNKGKRSINFDKVQRAVNKYTEPKKTKS